QMCIRDSRYTLFDGLGRTTEQLTISRERSSAPTFSYARGDPLVPAELPDLYSPVQASDFSWMDLSLSFLWWPEGTVIGTGEIRGRNCHLVELKNPDGSITADPSRAEKPSSRGSVSYAKVILWIDRQFPMLLQAEGYDREGRLVRKLWIKSLKKVDERWMVKDMEVQQYLSPHRTRICVRDVKPAG
ncbi:MAG: outer membrane lipoprotein-sorting protein, partial [Kiritimatiellae bacterium]|nr:outer membrane lipoprotein-sorting protein [Kiritimatiellia bacterium]